MEASADPCTVCGGIDTKLIDGFYYCIECGTQNTNVRETILEEKNVGDGPFGFSTRRKIVHIEKERIAMPTEWYRWHAFNFVISGLADELISLGAKPSFKTKLLWIWIRYIKKYLNKSELVMNNTQDENQTVLPSFMAEEDSNLLEEEASEDETNKKRNTREIATGSRRDIKFLCKGLIIAMLYLALNLDESDIQLSHLYRFIQEKHLNIMNLSRFLPDDINVKNVPQWTSFLRSKLCTPQLVRSLAMSLLRKLNLGTPKVPDLKKIVDNFLTELCLPSNLKPFIYSLMHFRKCSFLDINDKAQNCLIRIPDYEGTVMTYVLVAIKICFGLDCDYEIKLSNVVEKINDEKDLSKSYRIGKYSEPSERLFSFRSWCTYIQFRKVMLCKYNLHIAQNYCVDVDDYVYLEHMEERPAKPEELPDKISMEIIGRLPRDHPVGVIPKSVFVPSLTPLSDYTDIVIDYCQDPEIKLLLAEDFRRYSVKYICEDLNLLDSNMDNVINGVSVEKKIEKNIILGSIVTKQAKTEMVYVKNCENRNWMKTNPPTIEHVTCIEEDNDVIEKEASDHGYDSENTKEKDFDSEIKDKSLEEVCIDNRESVSIVKDGDFDELDLDKNKIGDVLNDNELHELNTDETDSDELIKHKTLDEMNKENLESSNVINDNQSHEENDEKIDSDTVIKDNELDELTEDKNDIDKLIKDEENDKRNIDTSKIENVLNDKNTQQIITEEDDDKNIFDDNFEDIDFKEECERQSVNNNFMNDDNYDENNPIQDQDIPQEDFDRRSDISDLSDTLAPIFNPETFDRDRTIKELILYTCNKYKIAIPPEYRTKEPIKRKLKTVDNNCDVTRPKRAKYEGTTTVKDLLSSYYTYMQSDFVTKVQREMSIAIRKSGNENENTIEDNDLSNINLEISVRSRATENEDNDMNQSERYSTIGGFDESVDADVTNKNDETKEYFEDLEKTLFEEDEVKLDDLLPKCDPKFDENKYDTEQLYIRMKEEEQTILDELDDPEIDKILLKKIEEPETDTKNAELKEKSKENIKKVEESDSEDDIPLSELKEESILVEALSREEENYEPLIKKEDIPDYNYWIRHYDKHYMSRSKESHKFDQELKENTPTSFYFVLEECASILNCSNFYLYKNLQLLEDYMIFKTKKVNSSFLDLDESNIIDKEEYSD